jgi:ribosomal protein S18 acetylase RimI-like enzyme
MTPQIRTIDESHASDLAALRRAALIDSPESFLASPEDDWASSDAAVRELLQRQPDSVVFGAYAPQLVGMLGVYRQKQSKVAHKAHLWGMFVLPPYRRQGLAVRLLEAAIQYARTLKGITSVHLSVSDSAIGAQRLYESAGFKTWGIEPDAIRVSARSQSEHHMYLALQVGITESPIELHRCKP